MSETASTKRNEVNEEAVRDAETRGYTLPRLISQMKAGIAAVWYSIGYVHAHHKAGRSRDTILREIGRESEMASENVSEYIGANAGAFTQRTKAAAVLAHVGLDLSDASIFDDETSVARLERLAWKTCYGARDAVLALPPGEKAWDALIAFHESTGTKRQDIVVEAREAAVEAARASLKTLPDSASTSDRRAAEKAVESAEAKAEKARETREKMEKRESGTSREASEFSIPLGKDGYDAVHAACDAYNGDAKGKSRVTIGEFVLMAVDYFSRATGEIGATAKERVPRARNAKAS